MQELDHLLIFDYTTFSITLSQIEDFALTNHVWLCGTNNFVESLKNLLNRLISKFCVWSNLKGRAWFRVPKFAWHNAIFLKLQIIWISEIFSDMLTID